MELLYTVAFVVGLGYGVLSVLVHGIADATHGAPDGIGGHDSGAGHAADAVGGADAGGHGFLHAATELLPLNTLTVATFLLGFGAVGLIATKALGLALLLGLILAVVGGLGVAFAFYAGVLRTLYRFQGSSVAQGEDILRATGEVITAIPSDGTGEIALVAAGSRMQLPARTRDGVAVARGARVVTLEVRQGIAYVAPLPEPSRQAVPSEE